MEWYEVAFDSLYPVIYEHRNIEEAEAVVERFAPLFNRSEPLLDLACGNGRYLECFARRGFEVCGLDLSHYLLRMCLDSWGHAGEILQADMRRLPLTDRSVGTVINMFTSFGYFSKDTDNLLVSKEVYRVLKPNGRFLFDFINAQKITADLLVSCQEIDQVIGVGKDGAPGYIVAVMVCCEGFDPVEDEGKGFIAHERGGGEVQVQSGHNI